MGADASSLTISSSLSQATAVMETETTKIRENLARYDQTLLEAEKGILSRVTNRYKDETKGNSSIEFVKDLKRLFGEMYVPSANWAMRPENTGMVLVRAVYVFAVNKAYSLVMEFAPNLRGVSLDVMKSDDRVRVKFADFVAVHIARSRNIIPASLTLNRQPDDMVHRARDAMLALQRVQSLNNGKYLAWYPSKRPRSGDGGGGGGGGGDDDDTRHAEKIQQLVNADRAKTKTELDSLRDERDRLQNALRELTEDLNRELNELTATREQENEGPVTERIRKIRNLLRRLVTTNPTRSVFPSETKLSLMVDIIHAKQKIAINK